MGLRLTFWKTSWGCILLWPLDVTSDLPGQLQQLRPILGLGLRPLGARTGQAPSLTQTPAPSSSTCPSSPARPRGRSLGTDIGPPVWVRGQVPRQEERIVGHVPLWGTHTHKPIIVAGPWREGTPDPRGERPVQRHFPMEGPQVGQGGAVPVNKARRAAWSRAQHT